jgi:hypothetical protein
MSPEYERELRILILRWSFRTRDIFKERVLAKGLLKKGELVDSFQIEEEIDFEKGKLSLRIKMALHGRFLDMKVLQNPKRGARRNKKRWGYSKTLARRVAELMDDMVILKSEHIRKQLLDSFRQ